MPNVFEHMDKKVPLVASVADGHLNDAVCTVRNSIAGGADGILIHLENLPESCCNEASLKELFQAAGDKAIMVCNYAYNRNANHTDEEILDLEFTALNAGAGCLDIRGDLFDRGAKWECSKDPSAIKKQRQAAEEIRRLGGQTIFSTHVGDVYLTPQQVLEQGKALEDRGADIVKIVMAAHNAREFAEGCQSTLLLRENIHVPILHILTGPYTAQHRIIAPLFGSCLVFCVYAYTPYNNPNKPLLQNAKAIFANFPFKR